MNVLGSAATTRTWIALLFETACDCAMVPGARDGVSIDQLADLGMLDRLHFLTTFTLICPIDIITARFSDLWWMHEVTLTRSILAAVVSACLLAMLVFLEVLQAIHFKLVCCDTVAPLADFRDLFELIASFLV